MLLHPVMREAVQKVQETLEKEGIPLKIFEAFRYPEKQADLYAQGRSKPGKVITYAQPWYSYHQYGLAVDFVIFKDGKWDWGMDGEKKKWWARMQELGKQYGLSPLDFETPHLQIGGTSSNALTHGHYPDGGDDAWAENLAASIASWQQTPSAPPSPKCPSRPSII